MKTLKTLLVIITICFSTTTQAQIWKKLAKKAEKAVEKTLEKKVEEKAERETDKAFDSTFNNSNKNTNKKGANIFGLSSIPPASTYKFSHKYVMQIDNGKKPVNIMYYLNKNDNFLGFEIPDVKHKTITVMDVKAEVIFMFMDTKGNKTLMSMNMNLAELTDEAIVETEYSITETGNTKTILGHSCKEFAVKGKDMHGTVWITEDADVSFAKTFYRAKQKKGMDQTWMSMVNGLPMEMAITDTSKRKPKTTTMHCISLNAENFSIDTSGYKKLM